MRNPQDKNDIDNKKRTGFDITNKRSVLQCQQKTNHKIQQK